MTRDVAGAAQYYGDICGWAFEVVRMGGEIGEYHVAMLEGVAVAGITDAESMRYLTGETAYWFSYFAVDDIEATIAATKAANGQVLRAPFVIPGTGRIAILQDPTGAAMGIMTLEPMG